VDRANGDNGNIGDLPWASVFDPAANARALSAIQSEGFRAASQLVDRFVKVARASADDVSTQISQTNGNTPTEASDLESLIRSWWSVMAQLARVPAGGGTSQSGQSVSLDMASADSEGQLSLRTISPGVATGEVWLHNRSETDRGEVQLRCGDLLAHDGGLIAANSVRFDPQVVPMPPRSSRGVVVSVEVEQGVAPGPHRGTVVAEDHPDLWLPVVVTVWAPAE
jgi:hypothetical protein